MTILFALKRFGEIIRFHYYNIPEHLAMHKPHARKELHNEY